MTIDRLPLSVPVSKNKRVYFNLNAYRNMHYQINNKAKQAIAGLIKNVCKVSGTIQGYPVELIYTIYRKDSRVADVGNIGAVLDKYVSDALVKLGYLPDDNTSYIKRLVFEDGGIDRQNPRATLEIREL